MLFLSRIFTLICLLALLYYQLTYPPHCAMIANRAVVFERPRLIGSEDNIGLFASADLLALDIKLIDNQIMESVFRL